MTAAKTPECIERKCFKLCEPFSRTLLSHLTGSGEDIEEGRRTKAIFLAVRPSPSVSTARQTGTAPGLSATLTGQARAEDPYSFPEVRSPQRMKPSDVVFPRYLCDQNGVQ
jgi:hypothetical protein